MSFRVGDRVRARLRDTGGHHRLPRYVQGRTGIVVAYRGAFPLPDAVVHDRAPAPQRGLYCVRFDAGDLWSTGRCAPEDGCASDAQGASEDGCASGDEGSNGHGVHLDLFEDYLRHESGEASS